MKKFFAILCGAACFVASVSFAAIAPEKIALGKITPGMSVNDLIAAYGQPNYKHGDDWVYNNFSVEVDNKHAAEFVEKVVARSGGISTPDGVSVGQSADILNSTFGKADDVDIEKHGVEYEYFSTDRRAKIKFNVVNNVITKISCKLID